MKKIPSFLILLLALVLVMPAMAASKKSKYSPLTKKYKNASLEQVLNDIQSKTGYKLSYVPDDMDLNARVNASFKDASAKTVLKKILGKTRYDIASKKGVITITLKPEPPMTYQVRATKPSEVQEDSVKTVRIWQDTTFSVACKNITRELPQPVMEEPAPTSKGHYIQVFLGAGYSQVGYKSEGVKDRGGIGGLAQFQYAYYFHENWGLTIGAGFDLYTDNGLVNHTYEFERTGAGAGDTDNGEAYIHCTEARNWKEKQLMGMVNVPVGIQCQYPLNENNLRLYAGLGVKVGIPLMKSYSLKSGEIQHTGRYDTWNLVLDEHIGNLGDDRDFYTESAEAFGAGQKKNMKVKTIAVSAMADLGVAIPVSEQVDIMVGAYADYCVNNIQDAEVQSMGWHQPSFPAGQEYREHAFMNDYNGLSATSATLRPWQVGIKVGVQWHHKQKPQPAPKEYERIQICDTTFTLAQRTDTTFKPQAAKKIVRMMDKAVIWFDLDKAEPKLEPADIIDRIAEVLLENPEQKILVNGHASKEGQAKHNQELSEQRAQAVADLLMEKGVPASQITVKGYSSQYEYTASNEQVEGGHHNISLDRRVEIIPVEE